MEPRPENLYTASHVAAALRLSKRTILLALADSAPSRTVIVQGNATRAWTVNELPAPIREAIAAKASADGLSLTEFLDCFVKPWQPAFPLAELAEACLAEATKLRAAILPALQRLDSPLHDPAERVRLGLADYERAFGYAITERHWRRLIDRTLRRDGGANDFNRLELYLPEKPTAKAAAARVLPAEQRFATLTQSLGSFTNPAAPTRTETAAFWSEVFQTYEAGAATRREQRALRRDLLGFLQRHAPWLATTQRALRVAFERKFVRWQSHGRNSVALLDGREEKRGVPTAPPIPQDDLDLITWKAVAECGGRVAQATRELAARGQRSGLSDGTLELVCGRGARKSYVNARLLNKVKSDVANIAPYLLGKKAIDDATAHIERDYSKLVSMQVVCADDLTPPVYVWIPDGDGGWNLTRGQMLAMLDVRSWKVVAWSLQPDRNYNSFVIRTLMNRVCGAWGIPSIWLYECGVWKKAHLVKGSVPVGWQAGLSALETETGWEKLGVQFKHAIRARSKPVERVFGLLQDMMHGVRGYCGRNEREDCPEVTKRAMDDVKFRRVAHPGELFLSFDEWNEQLGEIIARYNAASQDGEVLQGLSPDEAFEQHWPHTNPPAKLDANSWHLLAHYSRPVTVTANGITFRIGARKFTYRNERTGQDRGKTVLIHFDPECPEFLCVTDMNRKNPYLVERSTKVDFLAEPDDPVLELELGKAAAHSKHPRARYHVLKAKFAPTFRRNLVDAETAELAQDISRQRDALQSEQKQAGAQLTKARKAYGKLGMNVPARLRPEQTEAAAQLNRLLNEQETT